MEENDLFDQIHAHRKLVAATVNALVSADYLLYHLEDESFDRELPKFWQALKNTFNLLSLEEHEKFMILNPPYKQLYDKLFVRYQNLVKGKVQTT